MKLDLRGNAGDRRRARNRRRNLRGLAGVRVGINYAHSAAAAETLATGLTRDYGAGACALRGDLEQPAEIAALFDALERRLGPADILVNNAAYCPGGPLGSYSVETWEKTFRINVTAAFAASQEHVRRLTAAGRKGTIINIACRRLLGSTSGHLLRRQQGCAGPMTCALARDRRHPRQRGRAWSGPRWWRTSLRRTSTASRSR